MTETKTRRRTTRRSPAGRKPKTMSAADLSAMLEALATAADEVDSIGELLTATMRVDVDGVTVFAEYAGRGEWRIGGIR